MGDLGGKVDELTKIVTELTTELRLYREAGNKADAASDALHTDHEHRIAKLETWRTVQETTVLVAPAALTWSRFFTDARTWVLAGITALAAVWGFTH